MSLFGVCFILYFLKMSTVFIVCEVESSQNILKLSSEAGVQGYSLEKVFWKYAANLQENTHAEVRFQ